MANKDIGLVYVLITSSICSYLHESLLNFKPKESLESDWTSCVICESAE